MFLKKLKIADPRIETPLGKIPPGPLAFAQAVAAGLSIEGIAHQLGVDSATVYGFRAFWRELLHRSPAAGVGLDDQIRTVVEAHGLSLISLSPDQLAAIGKQAPGEYGCD